MPASPDDDEIKGALARIDDGKTMVHRHNDSEEIFARLVHHTLEPEEHREPVSQLEDRIRSTYDLDFANGYLYKIMEEYVVPAVARSKVPKEYFKRGIIKVNAELNTARRLSQLSELLWEKTQDAAAGDELDNIHQFLKLAQEVRKTEGEKKEALQKLGLVPGADEPIKDARVEHVHKTEDEDNVDDFMDHVVNDNVVETHGKVIDQAGVPQTSETELAEENEEEADKDEEEPSD
jgi:hypothetical protein